MIKEIAKSKNINLLKYFMISYNPNMIFENIWETKNKWDSSSSFQSLTKYDNLLSFEDTSKP